MLSGLKTLIYRSNDLLAPAIQSVLANIGANVACASASGGEGLDARASTPQQASSLVETALQTLGGLDSVIFLPARFALTPFLELEAGQWDAALQANLAEIMYLSQAAGHVMAVAGRGKLVFVTSIVGSLPLYETSLMATMLAGVEGFARVAAMELGPHGITANVIAPGWVDCGIELLLAAPLAADAAGREFLQAATPTRKMIRPQQVAEACAFLLSDSGSAVNGAVLKVDGGFSFGRMNTTQPYPGRPAWLPPEFDFSLDFSGN